MENNSLVENDDGESLLIFLMGFIFFACALVVVFMLIIKTRNGSGDGTGDGTGDGAGAPVDDGSRSPAVIQALATLPQDDGQTSLGIFLSLLGPLVLGFVTSAVPGLIIAAIRRLTDSSKTLIKSEIKALQSFKSATRPKFSARAIARSTKKLLTQKLGSLGLAARVRLGMIWGKALTRLGYTAAEMTQVLARRLGQAAAERIAAQIAARVAARVATASTHGPLMVFELAITAISLGLDLSNTGGWSNIDGRKTSDLLQQRAILEADLKNAYIGGFKDDNGVVDPSTAVGFYPLYWGPLDEMDDTVNSDGLDFFDVMVETKMFEMLMADNPDPFIVKLLENVARQYGVTSTDINDLFSASLLTDMTTSDYEDLYDRSFDSICIDNGGVLVDTGLAGRPKQCSHANETSCHAKSPWVEGQGIASSDTENTTYTEWRDRDFFNKNYTPAVVPDGAAGACIIADPTFHEMCSTEEICRADGATTERGAGSNTTCYKNVYIRNRGICQNPQTLCKGFGVSYCPDMRQRGGTGGECPTALNERPADLGDYASILLPGETLPSCYQATDDVWAQFFLGTTIYRYFSSGAFVDDVVSIPGVVQAGQNLTAAAVAVASVTLTIATYDLGTGQSYSYSPPGQKGKCFPGSSLVALEDSSVIQLRDLKLGMKVLSQCPKTGKPLFSEVFMWLVRDLGITEKYLKLTTSHGEILKLSSQHYLYVNDMLISAQEVKTGDVVYIHADKFEPTIVVEIENVFEEDAISPITVSGNIVINDVLASCVTTYEDLIGSSFPTLYLTKKTPPMMVHHWIFKNVFKYLGYKGVKFVKFLHTPLYWLAGLENPMSN